MTVIRLTPNRRLATHLRQDHNHQQQAKALLVWDATPLLPINTWLLSQWLRLPHANYILSEQQCLSIWQNIIEQSPQFVHIIDSQKTAELALQAWLQLQQWQQLPEQVIELNNEETKIWYDWGMQFQHYCQTQQVLDSASMITHLIEQYQAIDWPTTIELIGFDELTPQLQQLFATIPSRVTATLAIDTILTNESHTYACADRETEYESMARWASYMHQQYPTAKIVCVIPELNQQRDPVERIFRNYFYPQAWFNADYQQDIVNISGGIPLRQTPLVNAALQTLSLDAYLNDLQTLSEWLHTIFIAAGISELTERSQLDVALRKLNEPELSWRLIFNTLTEQQPMISNHFCQHWLSATEAWLAFRQQQPSQQSLANWIDDFQQELMLINWPGERDLNSHENQQMQRWQECLYTVTQLADDQAMNRHRALSLLNHYLQNTLFQIETENGPIQVLGLLEAAGLPCDYLWVSGLHNEAWPASADPNPFIPLPLQRKWQMPHSSASRELQFAQKITARFQQSAKQIIFSYPKNIGDKAYFISPLLNQIPLIHEIPMVDKFCLASLLQKTSSLETYLDEQGPRIDSQTIVRGGTGLIKAQANCPFQAFAKHRLQAEALATAELGFNALERGNMVHIALEHIWSRLGSQEQLLNYDQEKLNALITVAVDKALQKIVPYYSDKYKPRFIALEKERLQTLLGAWLTIEKQRPPFKVLEVEQWQQIQLANIQLNIQIDRIDELEDGHQLVIDYKTGKVSTTAWFAERLTEPQLPLYCLHSHAHGIAFAQVRSDKMSFKGVSDFTSHVTGIATLDKLSNAEIPANWIELIARWQQDLIELANEYTQGYAKVAPQPSACNHCEFTGLCRITELNGTT